MVLLGVAAVIPVVLFVTGQSGLPVLLPLLSFAMAIAPCGAWSRSGQRTTGGP